ncbi:hypothetical protein RFI_31667 [Reticulomyxa filosa]|uniref:CCHC-type domain-containing protein n=1 Tax=Reticulomyxa filosa TaxID=46433 RepID=X6LVS5_RETFI|nr:hypothetical protein RFI_31667 [Reticulomyxa filosa]|eukprot:ETO05729.1 hypothetical protein RFI_31667 [Reticulomyxa filosa]
MKNLKTVQEIEKTNQISNHRRNYAEEIKKRKQQKVFNPVRESKKKIPMVMVTLSKSEDVMKILQDKDLQNVYTIAQAVLFDKNKSRPKSYFKQCQNCFKLNHVAKECPSILNQVDQNIDVFLQKKASHSQSIQIKKKPDNKANHNEPNNRRRKRTKQTYNTRAVIQINDTNQEMKSTYQILTLIFQNNINGFYSTAGAEHPNSKNQKHSKNGNKMDAINNMDKFEKVVK